MSNEVQDDEIWVHGTDDVHETEPVPDRGLLRPQFVVYKAHDQGHGQRLYELGDEKQIIFYQVPCASAEKS